MTRDFSDLLRQGLEKYELLKFLHQNGEERAVFLGRNRTTREEVAVKVLAIGAIFGTKKAKKMLERFEREAYWVANLRHHDIVPIIDYIKDDDLICIVMPFFEYGTLGDLIEHRRRISLEDTVLFINQITPALEHAHSQNITHRDIKPSNFLCAQNGRLVLSDFGIARQTGNTNWETLTTANNMLGTRGYIDPEVLQGRKADFRADIYALGMVIYEMLHGASPFTEGDFMAVAIQQLQKPLPSLHEQHPEIPRAVDRVLRKATALHRVHRYDSVGELATALAQAAIDPALYSAPTEADFSNPAYPTTLPKQTSSSMRFLSGLPAWLLIGIVLLLFAGGFIFIQKHFSGVQSTISTTTFFTSSSAETNVQQAQDSVAAYYKNWNSGDYQAAYNLLSPDYQKKYPYKQELEVYIQTHYSCYTLNNSTTLADGSIQIDVTVNQITNNREGPGTVIYKYTLSFIAQKIQGQWRLIAENVQLVSKQGTCAMG